MHSLKLADINPHPRDKNISFKEEGHIYTIKGFDERPCSTTETIGKYHEHFDEEKTLNRMFPNGETIYKGSNKRYIGMTREEVGKSWEKARNNGTFDHEQIENFFNGDPVVDPIRKSYQMFLIWWEKYQTKYPNRKPYRSEWVIYDDDPRCKKPLAGSIDFCVIDENGIIHIIDWKFVIDLKEDNKYETKSGLTVHKKMFKPFNDLDDCNFNHYRLQLNFYRHVLITKYDKKIGDMMLVKLHHDQDEAKEYNIDEYDLTQIWHTLR